MQYFDVVVIGYGPTGKLLARLLSDAGKSVAIVERWPAAYPLPRGIGFDHEIRRLLHKLGLNAAVETISRPLDKYIWYNADWKVLIEIDQGSESISGGPIGSMFNQPEFEGILEDDLAGRPGITTFLSHEALSVSQDSDTASVTIAPVTDRKEGADTANSKTITAQYVVGCDGANSIVREAMGCEVIDHGFDSDWLVVDVIPNEDANLDIPDAAQWCNPARPTTIMPSGVRNRRWEFMVLPGETPEELVKEERVWELLSPWMTPADGALVRSATYNFRSRLAKGWRQGRLMIAGDAAHLMPPFKGQGMCTGLRDAWTLGWKLAAVLDGRSSDAPLDQYEASRAPQVDAVIGMSMFLGEVICVPDSEAAAGRDAAFFAGDVPPPPEFPGISADMINTDETGAPVGVAGQLMPHDEVTKDGQTKRLDNLHEGIGFRMLVKGLHHNDMTPAIAEALETLKCPVISFNDTG